MTLNNFLLTELRSRQERNPRYSLRAFARSISISPASLSLYLKGAQKITPQMAIRIIEQLDIDTDKKIELIQTHLTLKPIEFQNTLLSSDKFRMIADWYHFGILSLAEIPNNNLKSQWVSERLGITRKEAADALERLLRLGLIRKHGRGFVPAQAGIKTTTDIPLEALRNTQKQLLGLAITSLEKDPVESRDITSIVMAIDPEKLPEAKKRIQRFRRELCRFLESGKKEEVYSLAIQLFPNSKFFEPVK